MAKKRNNRGITAGFAASTKPTSNSAAKDTHGISARNASRCRRCESGHGTCNEVERAAFKYPMTRQNWELLERYASKYKDKESGRFAQDMLDMKRGNDVPDEDMEEEAPFDGTCEDETVPFAELEDDIRYQMEKLLADNINEFMVHKNYIPEGKELKAINEWVIKETSDAFFINVIPDATYNSLVVETIDRLVKEWEEDGFEIRPIPHRWLSWKRNGCLSAG